jgi:hypothetical protein
MPRILLVGSRQTSPGVRSRFGIRALLTFPITLLMAATGTGGAAAAGTHAASSTALVQTMKPPPTIWGACPTINRAAAEQKLVRRFDRAPGAATAVVPMPAGTSDLLCGTDGFGYYHIVARHYLEWTQKSVRSNDNWREVADYSIAEALRSPTSVTFRADRNTFCYSRQVSLIDTVRGITVDVMYPNVVVRAQDGAIITAYPSRASC